jgi:hypothetical protein
LQSPSASATTDTARPRLTGEALPGRFNHVSPAKVDELIRFGGELDEFGDAVHGDVVIVNVGLL